MNLLGLLGFSLPVCLCLWTHHWHYYHLITIDGKEHWAIGIGQAKIYHTPANLERASEVLPLTIGISHNYLTIANGQVNRIDFASGYGFK